MSWVTMLWSVEAAVCLTLGAMYLLVWLHQRRNLSHLLFAVSAMGVACFALFELAMMRAETPAIYAALVRWIHVPAWIVIVSLVWFVRLYLQAGRIWLAWTVCAVRTISLILNFSLTPNLNFREIRELEHLSWWGGESVTIAAGTPSPWTLVGQLSLLLLVVFVIDATATVWRRGERRRALVISSGMVLFVMLASAQSGLVIWGVARVPLIVSFPYLGILAVMAYELSADVLRAATLSAALQDSQQRVQLAVEATRLAVWNWDIARNRIWVSEEGRPLYGIPADEEISMEQFIETLHPADRKPARTAIDFALKGDGRFSAEFRVVLPDGSVRWINALGETDFHGNGRPLQLRGVSLDVTEQKRTELEAQQNRNELTHLSRVTMLGELSGSLAHELNQPLAAILSNAQAAQRFLARNPVDLDEVREILDDIVTQDRRAGEVIHRLRLLLKKGEVNHQPLDLNEVVLEVMKLMRSDLVNQHVLAEPDLASSLPVVIGDRVQLQQVLLNLVMNAVEAMSASSIADRRITVRTECADTVGVEVRDHGRGILDESFERVFEPFYTTKAKGLGLGLSVCRTIITAHGGRLDARNNADGGATFRFTLPISESGKGPVARGEGVPS